MLPLSLVSPRLVLQGMWRFQQIGILLGCSWYLWWALLDFYASMVVRMWVGIRKNKICHLVGLVGGFALYSLSVA